MARSSPWRGFEFAPALARRQHDTPDERADGIGRLRARGRLFQRFRERHDLGAIGFATLDASGMSIGASVSRAVSSAFSCSSSKSLVFIAGA
jgi:hypothetical protein